MSVAAVRTLIAALVRAPRPARKRGRRPATRLQLENLESRELPTLQLAPAPAAGVGVRPVVQTVIHNNSADRAILWNGAWNVAALTDAALDAWARRGIDGFVLQAGRLAAGLGGTQQFTGDPEHPLTGSAYDLQRRLRDSGIVGRAAARGLKLYLGFYTANYYNPSTPLKDWFDDAGWANVVLPQVRNLAAAARLLGFAGLAVDQEPYPGQGGSVARWTWDYPGNTRTQAQTRAMARQRGAETMGAIRGGFPDVQLVAYHVQLPESWAALVQLEVNAIPNAYQANLDVNFWDGVSGVEGYRALRWLDAIFYKTTHRAQASWDEAFLYNAGRVYSLLSRNWSNWAHASSRLHLSPFVWINPGPSPGTFDDARPPAYVAEQLANSRVWGAGGEFGIYHYGGLDNFNYTPYEPGMAAASRPGNVDARPPALGMTPPPPGTAASTLDLAGSATDDLAVRAIRWVNQRGGSGAAALTWAFTGDYRVGYTWRMDWAAGNIPLQPGANPITVTVEDLKGGTTITTVTVTRTSGLGPGVGPAALRVQDVRALAHRAGPGGFAGPRPWADAAFAGGRGPEGDELATALLYEFGHRPGRDHAEQDDAVRYEALAAGVRTAAAEVWRGERFGEGLSAAEDALPSWRLGSSSE